MHHRSGFTLVEILIIMGILAILFTISSLNLSNTVPQNDLSNATELLIANLKQQQLSALTGNTEAQSASSNYGIYFTAGKYVLFRGNSYNANDSGNYVINTDDINDSTTASGSVLIFQKNTGQILNFQPANNTITLTHTSIQKSKTITLNKYGVIESIL
jgi:Tfp pilus assembly protein FimT